MINNQDIQDEMRYEGYQANLSPHTKSSEAINLQTLAPAG